MKYPFIIKDDHRPPIDEPAGAGAVRLFKVFLEFDSWYKDAKFPGKADIDPHGDYIDVEVDDSVALEKIEPILDKLGYKPTISQQ